MWIHKPFFKYATGILLTVLIIFFLGQIDYFLKPFQITIAAVFFPILIAGVFYYILRFPVSLLSRYMPKGLGISVLFLIISLIIASVAYIFYEPVANQVKSIAELAPQKAEEVSEESEEAVSQFQIGPYSGEQLRSRATDFMQNLGSQVFNNVATVVSAIANVVIVIAVLPFLLFFFLKDDERLHPFLMRYIPEEHTAEGEKILKDVDATISAYIIGQFLVALTDAVLLYIGFLIIGLDYAFTLAFFAMFLMVIPFLGPVLGVLPAIFVALMDSPLMVLAVIIVQVIVQLLEGNLVTPEVMNKRLKIHPITIILLLLVSASLYGFIGVLIAIPLYAIIKTLVHNFRLFYRLRKKDGVNPNHTLNKN